MITKLQVKYIQSLGQKKFRDEEGVFVAEGPKIINELLAASPAALMVLYATSQWMQANAGLIKNIATDKAVEIKDHELDKLFAGSQPVHGAFLCGILFAVTP